MNYATTSASFTKGAYGTGHGMGTTYQAARDGDYAGAMEAGLPLAAMALSLKSPIKLVTVEAQRSLGIGQKPTPLKQRDFTSDYPQTPRHDGEGRLLETIDGAEIQPTATVIGRTRLGERDTGLLGSDAYSEIAKKIGISGSAQPNSAFGRNEAGYLQSSKTAPSGWEIAYKESLSPGQREIILGHELGHGLDKFAPLSTSGIERSELRPNYSHLAGDPTYRTKHLTGPEHAGYGPKEVKPELTAEALRPTWDEPSIQERNLMLYNGIANVLGFNTGKDRTQIWRDLTDEQISKIYLLYEALWPRETDLLQLLPKPDGACRAIYTGSIHPIDIAEFALGASLYFAELLIEHPFPAGIPQDGDVLPQRHAAGRRRVGQPHA